MTAFDFATLASSSLPPVSGDSSSAGASSWNMSTYAPVVAPSAAPARGGLPSFLNRSGIDANRMQQLSHGLQSAPSGNTSGNSSGVSVQAMIHQRRKNILNKLFTDEMNKTQDRCDKMHANRMKKDWEEQKELYAKEVVGDRRLGGSSTKKFESMTATTTGSNGNYTALSSSHANQLQYQVDDHLSLVKKMNKPNAPDDVASIIYDFIRLASKSPSYAAAWKLVYALQQGKSDTPLGRAIATMSHLGRQFRAHVENRVRSATSSGQVSAGDATNNKYTGMARTVATYVQLTVGSTNPSSHQWAIMYYCLRCGDFVAAKQAIDANTSGGGSHDLSAALETYARQQGTEPFFWDQVTFVNAIAPLSTSYNQNTSPSNDDFEEACWSLLSDADPDRLGSSPLVNTIEDFVYVSMWNAIFGGTQDALLAVGKNIKDLGAGHFQGGESTNSWSYAMPLLLTQQYGSSILHLATKGGDEGVLQATHLSLFLPEVERDSSLLTSLLTQLASNLKARSASSAVEYLVRIPNESQRRTKIVELIVESRQFEELGGSLSTDGVRNGEKAALDQHFPPDVVCDLLEQAALFASRNNNTRDALELLNLANRYTGLLSMLNQQLASLLNQDPSAEKEFWLKAARSFNSWHFGGRRTHAMEVIEANKSVALIDVFRTLLELFTFIERLIIHDFKEATTIVDGLNILPRSSDELQAKVSNYEQMNPVLKGVFPSIVHGAMTALYQQFMRTQHSGMASGGAVVHLKEMKNKASLLTSFASTLDLPYDLVSRMTTMEAQMV